MMAFSPGDAVDAPVATPRVRPAEKGLRRVADAHPPEAALKRMGAAMSCPSGDLAASERPGDPWLTSEDLVCLDLLHWLGHATRVAEVLACNSATVVRRALRCARFLGLELKRSESGWMLAGRSPFLAPERLLQQQYRLAGFDRLRLDVSALAAPLLGLPTAAEWLPETWMLGSGMDLSGRACLQLLSNRVTDALVCEAGMADAVAAPSATWRCDPLIRLPLRVIGSAELVAAWAEGLRQAECLVPLSLDTVDLGARLSELGLRVRVISVPGRERRWEQWLTEGRAFRVGTAADLLGQPDRRVLPGALAAAIQLVLLRQRDLTGPRAAAPPPMGHLLDVLYSRVTSLQMGSGMSPC